MKQNELPGVWPGIWKNTLIILNDTGAASIRLHKKWPIPCGRPPKQSLHDPVLSMKLLNNYAKRILK